MAQESPFAESVAANGILIGAFWIVAQPHKAAAHKITRAGRQSRIVNAITGPTSPSGTKRLNYDDFETLIQHFAFDIVAYEGGTSTHVAVPPT